MAKRKWSGSTSKKRKRFKKKSMKKSLKSMVIRALRSRQETKNKAYATTTSLTKSVMKTWNVFYHTGISQGTGNNQFVGNELRLTGIKFIFDVASLTSVAYDTYLYIALIRFRGYNTLTSLTSAEVRQGSSLDSSIDLDSDKCKLLKQWRIKLPASLANRAYYGDAAAGPINLDASRMHVQVKKYLKIGKDIKFEDYSTDYKVKNGNFYVCAYAASYFGTAAATSLCDLGLNWRLYYTDS
nr:capsid protein [Cressdnaviricota sp.]